MKRKLSYYGNPILRTHTPIIESLDDEVRRISQDLMDTLEGHETGVGLAAPQIHENTRIFALHLARIFSESQEENAEKEKEANTDISNMIQVYINPKILATSKETCEMLEGCLSIPNLYLPVTRPKSLTVEAMNLQGEIFTEQVDGFKARVIMHENDHLNGVLFIDRISKKDKKDSSQFLRELKKKYKGSS